MFSAAGGFEKLFAGASTPASIPSASSQMGTPNSVMGSLQQLQNFGGYWSNYGR
jgi:hypothetical protein